MKATEPKSIAGGTEIWGGTVIKWVNSPSKKSTNAILRAPRAFEKMLLCENSYERAGKRMAFEVDSSPPSYSLSRTVRPPIPACRPAATGRSSDICLSSL